MTKLAGQHVQVLVDGYELTGDMNHISIPDARDVYDVTAFGDVVHKFIAGRRTVTLEHSGYMNADSARSHPALSGDAVEGIATVLLGQNAAPADGDPAYSLAIRQGKYSVIPKFGSFVSFSATLANRGELGGWGLALGVPTSFTNTANGSAVDGGAASSDGGAAYLHLLTAAATDRYTLVVEGSTTGAFAGEESTLATFTLDGAEVGSEFITISGSIPRYTRWKATRAAGTAGDTVKIAVTLVRF